MLLSGTGSFFFPFPRIGFIGDPDRQPKHCSDDQAHYNPDSRTDIVPFHFIAPYLLHCFYYSILFYVAADTGAIAIDNSVADFPKVCPMYNRNRLFGCFT